MDNSEYTKIYSTLGVFQDDSWEVIRTAYKKQITRWHPDRFQDPSYQRIAEEKSKDINYAYQRLCDYYDKFGVMPPDHTPERLSAVDSPTSWETVPSADLHDPPGDYPTEAVPATSHYRYIPTVLIGVLIAIGYSIWEPAFLVGQSAAYDEMDMSEQSDFRLDDESAQDVDTTLAANNLHISANTDAWVKEKSNGLSKTTARDRESNYHNEFETVAATAAAVLIRQGSSMQEVLAAQGPPQRQTDSAWDYGASRIYFKNGHVSGWYENPLNPLNVTH